MEYKKIKNSVIIGSSRGLGAALVNEFIDNSTCNIIGVSRTKLEELENYERWAASGRYRHIEMDITSPACRESLKAVSSALSPEPVCVIFNCAYIEKDIKEDRSIKYEVYNRTNKVGIDGFGNVLFAFENSLLRKNSIFVGISSFWGTVPPLFLSWMAYPATKAYLNMALRCLKAAWRDRSKVVVVNMGNIDTEGKSTMPKWMAPDYSAAARKIVKSLSGKKIPRVINYPFLHFIICRCFLRFVPEIVYLWVFKLYFKILKFFELKKKTQL